MASNESYERQAFGSLAPTLIELSRTGQHDQLFRFLLERSLLIPGASVAAAGLVDAAHLNLDVTRAGSGGLESMVIDGTGSHPLAQAVRTGLPIQLGNGHPGRIGDGEIEVAVPVVDDGEAIGSLGVGGASLSAGARSRLEELAALASLALENVSLQKGAVRSVTEIATVLSSLIESRDTYTESHCVALAEMSVGVGIRMGLDDAQLTVLNLAGHLHDIGKVSIPDDVLLKRGPLDEDEFAIMKSHAALGEKVLSQITHFAGVAPVVGQHHERFDGSGYPRGLRGDQILLEARILAVVDAFDAMTSSRPYRPALSSEIALHELSSGIGSQFDPNVTEIFLEFWKGEQAQWRHHERR